MSEFKSYRDQSRLNWGSENESLHKDTDRIKLGAHLRIADAMELMAKNHAQLIEERDRFKRWWQEEQSKVSKLYRRVAALRGVITRLKKSL